MPYMGHIGSFLAGLVGGSLLTLSISRNRQRGSGSLVDQSSSSVRGDQVGGSKNTYR